MKKIVGVIIFIMVIASGVFISYIAINTNDDNKTNINTVKVIQNKFNSDEKNIVEITNQEDIKEIEKIYNDLLKLDTNYYNLVLTETTDIMLNNDMIISIQLSDSTLCKYSGLDSSEFVETPQGLIDWINKVL